jgi:cardiolipin synthase
MYRTDCIADVEADFQQTLAQCRTVTEETVKNEKFTRKLAGTLAKFIAPLL